MDDVSVGSRAVHHLTNGAGVVGWTHPESYGRVGARPIVGKSQGEAEKGDLAGAEPRLRRVLLIVSGRVNVFTGYAMPALAWGRGSPLRSALKMTVFG